MKGEQEKENNLKNKKKTPNHPTNQSKNPNKNPTPQKKNPVEATFLKGPKRKAVGLRTEPNSLERSEHSLAQILRKNCRLWWKKIHDLQQYNTDLTGLSPRST